MAGGADIRAGRAFVELFLKNSLTKGLSVASKQLKSFGSATMRIGGLVTAAGTAMTSAFIAPIKAAGDLAETMSKFNAVFGDQAPAAEAWMNKFTEAVGRGKQETADALSAFGAFFQGLDMGREKSAGLAKELTALAVDFGSFHNMTDTEAMQRFISALSGSGEVLSMYGVNIMEAALNQKLLAMGFPTIAKGATEVQKVMARMSIIKESMGRQGAVGDAVRTADSFSNQLKRLRGTIMDTSAAVGKALLPVVTPLVVKAGELVKVFATWAEGNGEAIRTAFKLALGITAAGVAITGLGAAVYGVGAVLGALVTTAGALAMIFSPAGVLVAGLTIGVAAWIKYSGAIQSTADIFKKAWGGISDALTGGDLALAGKIAFSALKAVAYDAFESIRTAFRPVVDSIIGLWDVATTFFSTATDGFKSAWSTFAGFFSDGVGDMGNGWADFAEGLVAVFTTAARAVTGVWQKTVGSLAQGFLQLQEYTGIDLRAEQKRRRQAEVDMLQSAENQKSRADEALARFKSGGGVLVDDRDLLTAETKDKLGRGRADADVLADLEATAADAARTLENVQQDQGVNLRKQASAVIDANVAAAANDFRKKLEGVDRRAQARGQEGDDLFRPMTAAERARAELDRLTKQARDKATAEKAAAAGEIDAAAAGGLNAMKGGASVGSFSGAALMASARGGNKDDKVVKQLKKHEKLEQSKIKIDLDILKSLEKPKPQVEIVG